MILLTNKGNKKARVFANVLAKVAAVKMNVDLTGNSDRDVETMIEDRDKLYLIYSDSPKDYLTSWEAAKVVILSDDTALQMKGKLFTTEELEADNARVVNEALDFWRFARKVLPDFKLIQDSDTPTPSMSLEFIQGIDYFTMRIKKVDWKNAEKFSAQEMEVVENRLKKDFLDLSIKMLREKLLPTEAK